MPFYLKEGIRCQIREYNTLHALGNPFEQGHIVLSSFEYQLAPIEQDDVVELFLEMASESRWVRIVNVAVEPDFVSIDWEEQPPTPIHDIQSSLTDEENSPQDIGCSFCEGNHLNSECPEGNLDEVIEAIDNHGNNGSPDDLVDEGQHAHNIELGEIETNHNHATHNFTAPSFNGSGFISFDQANNSWTSDLWGGDGRTGRGIGATFSLGHTYKNDKEKLEAELKSHYLSEEYFDEKTLNFINNGGSVLLDGVAKGFTVECGLDKGRAQREVRITNRYGLMEKYCIIVPGVPDWDRVIIINELARTYDGIKHLKKIGNLLHRVQNKSRRT